MIESAVGAYPVDLIVESTVDSSRTFYSYLHTDVELKFKRHDTVSVLSKEDGPYASDV